MPVSSVLVSSNLQRHLTAAITHRRPTPGFYRSASLLRILSAGATEGHTNCNAEVQASCAGTGWPRARCVFNDSRAAFDFGIQMWRGRAPTSCRLARALTGINTWSQDAIPDLEGVAESTAHQIVHYSVRLGPDIYLNGKHGPYGVLRRPRGR
jgi:hypothetical protein